MSYRRIIPGHSEWPRGLTELGPGVMPQALYVEGRGLVPHERAIAIVGTRRPTVTGLQIAAEMATAFVEAGYVVVSGLALGIDAAAHRAALDAGGTTIAVLGCGIDVVYPIKNERLHRQIAARGTIVSELPPGSEPHARHFPARNRIIVGLSRGVVVVEGGYRSGALITARIALDANRDVCAVPGSPRNAVAVGPNRLIKDGNAALVTSAKEVFDVLAPTETWQEPFAPKDRVNLAEDEQRVLHCLESVPYSVDQIARACGMKPGVVALTLSKLELRGLAARTSSGRFEVTGPGLRVSLATV